MTRLLLASLILLLLVLSPWTQATALYSYDSLGRLCNCKDLGYALHTAQDSAAGGHQYQTYYGLKAMQSFSGLIHFLRDYMPSEDRREEAIVKSKNVVAQYKAQCKKCSK